MDIWNRYFDKRRASNAVQAHKIALDKKIDYHNKMANSHIKAADSLGLGKPRSVRHIKAAKAHKRASEGLHMRVSPETYRMMHLRALLRTGQA